MPELRRLDLGACLAERSGEDAERVRLSYRGSAAGCARNSTCERISSGDRISLSASRPGIL